MKVEVTGIIRTEIDIEPVEALCTLCKTLYMEFALDEDREFIIKKNDYDENVVYEGDKLIDDRGDLFIAIRNVIVNIVPNTLFRSANYIYGDK